MKFKEILLPFLWLILVQQVLAQPLQRKAEQTNDEFTLVYTFSSDSLKGFFEITENFTGQVKLLHVTCKLPYHFENGRLQIGGDKIVPGTMVNFRFRLQDETVLFSGFFHSENFGRIPYEMNFETVKMQKPVMLAEVKKTIEKSETPVIQQQKNETLAKSATSTSATETPDPKPEIQNQQSETKNEERSTKNVPPVSFRVQLAASLTPMDKQKLQQLSGLALNIQEDRIDGYYKYTIGNEKSLKEAQALLNRVPQANFKKPFIVAYRQNERISVQEAMTEINRLHP